MDTDKTVKHIKLFFASFCLLLLCPAIDAKPDAVRYEPVKETVSQLIRKEMSKNDVVGLSIALVDDQKVVWAQGFGYADEKKEIPATAETVYRIGTLTNLFTVVTALQLAEQGALDIDRPVQSYLPEFSIRDRSGNADVITLRSLMTHHSGLPASLLKGMWSSKPGPFTEVVNLIKDEYAPYPPGYRFSQSTVGMSLVGHVVERVSGHDYTAFLEESLLQPVGMARSGFSPAGRPDSIVSRGYRKGKELAEPLQRDLPAGGLSSTVMDLGRFMQMVFSQGSLNGRQILKPGTMAEMLRPQNANVPLDLGMTVGLGWMLGGLGDIDIRNAGTVAHHGGGTLLFHSQMIVLPEHRLGVVILANSTTSGRMVSKAAVEAITRALEAKTGIKQPVQTRAAESDEPVSREVQKDYIGLYASMAGLAEIKARSDHFHAEVMNRTLQLGLLKNGRFNVKYRVWGLIPISLGDVDFIEISRKNVAGRELLVAGMKGRDMLIAEKISPAPVSAAWLKRAGEYRIENLGDDFPLLEGVRLRLENNTLLAECEATFFYKGAVRFPLRTISDTEAIIEGLGRGMGETVRAVMVKGKEALLYSGYVLRRRDE